MPVKIKTQLIKTLILPVIDYPPIPTHALSNNQLGILQRVQNKALRYAYNQRYPYTHTTEELHALSNIEPVNIRLHNKAIQIWEKIQTLQIPHYTTLTQNMENITRYNTYFPSSINKLNGPPPEPLYH